MADIESTLGEFRALLREVGPPPTRQQPWTAARQERFRRWLDAKPERRAWLGLEEERDAHSAP